MPRHRSAASCKILPWLSAKKDGGDGRFLQVGNSLFLSPHFQALSSGARVLYLAMALESTGKRTFTFPLTAARKHGFASTSFRRYVAELTQAGFIEYQSGANVREANIYTFLSAWKDCDSSR